MDGQTDMSFFKSSSQLYRDVERATFAIFEKRRLAAIARVREKNQLERALGEFKCLCDDLRSSGVNLDTVEGKAVLGMVLRQRMVRAALIDDEMPESDIGGDW
jgi:hypothetical protein